MRHDNLEKVLDRLAVTEKTTLALARETDGKIRVASGSWESEKVFLRDQVLEIRNGLIAARYLDADRRGDAADEAEAIEMFLADSLPKSR